MAGLIRGEQCEPCTGEMGGEERGRRELARGFGEEERLPRESSPSGKRRGGGVLLMDSAFGGVTWPASICVSGNARSRSRSSGECRPSSSGTTFSFPSLSLWLVFIGDDSLFHSIVWFFEPVPRSMLELGIC